MAPTVFLSVAVSFTVLLDPLADRLKTIYNGIVKHLTLDLAAASKACFMPRMCKGS
jgi:hypothetical protein